MPLLLLGLGGLAPATAATATALPDPARFDALIAQVERGDPVITGPQEIQAVVARLAALRPVDDPRRALRLRGFRCDYEDLGPPASGLAFARAGLADARRLDDVGAQIRFGLCEAAYLEADGQITEAAIPTEAALALAREHAEPRLLAQALGRRGNQRSLLGQQAAALTDFLEAQRVYRGGGLSREAEANLHEVAIAYRRMGEHDKALEYLRQSVAFAEREARWGLLAVSLIQTAFVHQDHGHYDRALAAQRRAAQVATTHGLGYELAAAHLGMAAAQVKLGAFDAAADALATAREGFAGFGDRSNEGMLQLLQGQVLAGHGGHAAALARYQASARAFAADPNPRYLVELYAARARSHEALGDYRAALDDLKLERSGREQGYDGARIQQSLLLQYQFDTARHELENARLLAERRSQQQQLDAIGRANRWQVAALVSGGLLLALLLALLLRQLRRLRRINALALTDALTGLANRRHVETAAVGALAAARRRERPLAVLTFDLDRFKRINDGHGHAHGDQVLIRVARACESELRHNDLLGRIGGEEFVVLCPDTPLVHAGQAAERLRVSVERIDLSDIAPGLRVTVSVGLSLLRTDDNDLADVMARADAALYRAKAAGRNRVEAEA
ncbi:MAG: diguanylate cyclase [Lysobacter sp.]